MSETRFPPLWDDEGVRIVLEPYERQAADEAVAEDEAAFELQDETVMKMPRRLVSAAVRQLLAKHPQP